MARSEARIFTSIWRDPEFLALTPTAQRLFVFLLSQDDVAYCGVMPLRARRWTTKAAGMTLHDIEADLKALEAAGRMFVVIDHDSEELLIRSLMRHDGIWKQPNLLKLARESADQVQSPKLRGVLLAELRRLPLGESGSDNVKTLVADFIADLEKGCPYPSPYPTDHPDDQGSDEGAANPSADPSDDHYVRARGLGESYVPVLGSPVPPYPEAPTALPARDHKQGHRLPDDFAVDDGMRAWARQKTPHVDVDRETERFCDHWRSKPGRDGRKLDWRLTWNNWMRTAEDRQGPRGRPARQDQTDDWTQRALSRAQARQGELT